MLNPKVSFLGALLFFTFFKGNAQDQQLVAGIDAGAGLSFATDTDSAGNTFGHDGSFALFAGIQAEYRFNELISIRSGLYYESKRSEYSGGFSLFGIGQTIAETNDFRYLTLPLAFQLSFGQKTRFYLGAGPYFGFLLSQRSEVTTTGFFNGHSVSDNKDDYKPVDIGLTAHAGVGIPLSDRLELSFTLRDNLGLTNMYKDPKQEGKVWFNCFYLTAGLGILLQ